MLHIPISRWGVPYKSLDLDKVVHFATGEVLAEVSRANGGLVERDMRHATRARGVLREIPIKKLLEIVKKAGELYANAELPLGDGGTQTPAQFARMQSGRQVVATKRGAGLRERPGPSLKSIGHSAGVE